MIHALSVQLRQVFSWKLLSCILVFAGVQGLAISGLIYVTPDPSALYTMFSARHQAPLT